MHLRDLLRYVEVSQNILEFEEYQGKSLRCCERILNQFACNRANSIAMDDYISYWVFGRVLSAMNEDWEGVTLPTNGDSDPESDDY